MSTHLFTVPHPSQSTTSQLRVLTAYENGGLCLWAHTDAEKKVSVEGIGWQALWQVKVHAESIMAMAVSPLKDFAITVSADNLVVRCNLNDEPVVQHEIPHDGVSGRLTVHRTKHPGNGFVAIQHGGRVCAVAGWDGKIRLYSTKSFKSLGTLSYHKGGCQCVTFASPDSAAPHPGDPDDDIDAEDREKHARWLVSGATDKRVVVWELMDFDRAKS
ncbi:ASTRA complex subunit [Tulasnella sp. 403]|nr:ASTRA complex subunit [Tulasnella sp. 403]